MDVEVPQGNVGDSDDHDDANSSGSSAISPPLASKTEPCAESVNTSSRIRKSQNASAFVGISLKMSKNCKCD